MLWPGPNYRTIPYSYIIDTLNYKKICCTNLLLLMAYAQTNRKTFRDAVISMAKPLPQVKSPNDDSISSIVLSAWRAVPRRLSNPPSPNRHCCNVKSVAALSRDNGAPLGSISYHITYNLVHCLSITAIRIISLSFFNVCACLHSLMEVHESV